ncbi:chemotaxis protein CheW [bacterium]|nr:chemotaxis protein CheW [bacterium]
MKAGKRKADPRTESVLKERARALARQEQSHRRPQKQLSVVMFQLAQEDYAVETRFVRQVHPLKELTEIPGTPDFVLGVVNIHGEILSLVELKKFFGLPERGLTDLNKILVLEDGRMEFGVLADEVHGTRLLDADQIRPPGSSLNGIGDKYLLGVTPERIIVLNAAKLLSDPELRVNDPPSLGRDINGRLT